MKQLSNEYYMKTKKRWMGVINSQIKASQTNLNELYGNHYGEQYTTEIRNEFERLLKELPQLDPKMGSLYTRQLVLTNVFLSVYNIMHKKHKKSLDESWEFCMMMFGGFLKSLPNFFKKLARKGTFSKRTLKGYRKDDEQSKKRVQPKGDVLNFIEGDGKEFDYCIEFTECAKVKYLKEQNASEFAPYVCLVDKLIAEYYKTGLIRTMTIADGYDTCDFKMTNDGIVDIKSPVWKDEWEKYL